MTIESNAVTDISSESGTQINLPFDYGSQIALTVRDITAIAFGIYESQGFVSEVTVHDIDNNKSIIGNTSYACQIIYEGSDAIAEFLTPENYEAADQLIAKQSDVVIEKKLNGQAASIDHSFSQLLNSPSQNIIVFPNNRSRSVSIESIKEAIWNRKAHLLVNLPHTVSIQQVRDRVSKIFKDAESTSKGLGKPGETIQVSVEVIDVKKVKLQNFTSFIFRTIDQQHVVWSNASQNRQQHLMPDMNFIVGKKLKIRGRVESHSDKFGPVGTVLSRLQVVEELL